MNFGYDLDKEEYNKDFIIDPNNDELDFDDVDKFYDVESFVESDLRTEDKKGRNNSRRRIVASQLERKVRRKQLFLKRLRILVRLVFIAALVFCFVKLVKSSSWYLSEDVFKYAHSKYLRIYGNKITPDYQILSALRRVKFSKVPIYMLDTSDFKREILNLDPVLNVYILRFWFPTRLEVIIEEREPILTIAPSENVNPIAFFAQGGKLIGRQYLPLDPTFKTIKVLSYGIGGDDYHNWNEHKVKSIESLANTIEAYSGEKLIYLDMRKPNDIYAKIQSADLRIGDFNDTILKRVKSIRAILPQVKNLEKKIQYIDLRWDDAHYIKLKED